MSKELDEMWAELDKMVQSLATDLGAIKRISILTASREGMRMGREIHEVEENIKVYGRQQSLTEKLELLKASRQLLAVELRRLGVDIPPLP